MVFSLDRARVTDNGSPDAFGHELCHGFERPRRVAVRCTVVRMRATDADVAVDGGEWTVEVATEMRAATAAVPSQTQQLAEVSGLRWVGETPPAIAIAECEKAEGARAEGGERKRKREGCGL